MIPFVDEVLNVAATDNKIKYLITHADNTTEIVEMNLYTPVETEGTEMNKVYFDSIDSTIHEPTVIDTKTQLFNQSTATTYTVELNTSGRRYVLFAISGQATSQTTPSILALFDCNTNKFVYAYNYAGNIIFDTSSIELYYRSGSYYITLQSATYSNNKITVTLKGTKHATAGNITLTIRTNELDGYVGGN